MGTEKKTARESIDEISGELSMATGATNGGCFTYAEPTARKLHELAERCAWLERKQEENEAAIARILAKLDELNREAEETLTNPLAAPVTLRDVAELVRAIKGQG